MNLVSPLVRHAAALPRYELPTEGTRATNHAASNFARNVAALERVWPRAVLALPESPAELEWLYARDGALSGRHVDRRWVNDVSVPRRAADRMFAKLAIQGTTGVLLAPTHAAQVRRALDKLAPQQTLIVVMPVEFDAGVIVACDDFSDAILARRLWLAAGPLWDVELTAILDAHEGIAPATTMIRVQGLNAAIVDLIQRPCEVLLAQHAQAHKQAIGTILARPRVAGAPARRVCVAGGTFALWDDAGPALHAAAARSRLLVTTHDLALPTHASALSFARAAGGCDAVVTTRAGRADLPGLVPDDVPWLTWATGPRVPAFVPGAAADGLAIADVALRAAAAAAGWPASRVVVATEPHDAVALDADAEPMLLADLAPVAMPASVLEMSSHRVVWEQIERDLTDRPLAARPAVDAYLLDCAARVGVPRESFPLALFRDALALPLLAREAARALAARGVRFTIRGRGWQHVPELADRLRGEVDSPEAWREALGEASVLFDVWPGAATHRARRSGRPLVGLWGRPIETVIAELDRPSLARAAVGPTFDLDALVGHMTTSDRAAA